MNNELSEAQSHLKRAEEELAAAEAAERKAEDDIKEAIHEVEQAERREHEIAVEVATTSGSYPSEGTKLVPRSQLVKVILDEAKHEIPLADTTKWIATVGKVTINLDLSYEANGLSCEAIIDWGPVEGGGGA